MAARAAYAQTTHGRGLPMSRSRRLRRVGWVMSATLPVDLRLANRDQWSIAYRAVRSMRPRLGWRT